MTWIELIDKHSDGFFAVVLIVGLTLTVTICTWASNRPNRK